MDFLWVKNMIKNEVKNEAKNKVHFDPKRWVGSKFHSLKGLDLFINIFFICFL